MALSKQQLLGTVFTIGVVALFTVGFVATSVSSSPAQLQTASIEKAVQSRFAIPAELTTAYWTIVHLTTKYAIADLVPSAPGGPLTFKLLKRALDSDLSSNQKVAWEHMLSEFPADDCKYGIFDWTYSHPDGKKTEKVVLVTSRVCTNDVRQQMDITYGIADLLNAYPTIDVSLMSKLPGELSYTIMADIVEKCVLRNEGCVSSSKMVAPQGRPEAGIAK